ncbi:MAG: hypothetical protein IPL43_12460 [Micropruina sp.]|nr:hypothetical protein [Micropruina sp.]
MPGVSDVHGILLRSESAASSEIENLTVGAKQLAIAELGGAARRNANLVSRNVHGTARPTPTAYPRSWTSSRSARAAGPEPAGSR